MHNMLKEMHGHFPVGRIRKRLVAWGWREERLIIG